MPAPDATAPDAGKALVAALATLTLAQLALGLLLPIVTFRFSSDYTTTERVITLWQEALDEGLTEDGGASVVLRGVLLLVVVIAALLAMWSVTLMYGGGIGNVGTTLARGSSAVLLVGAAVLAFYEPDLVRLAGTWNNAHEATPDRGLGAWWFLSGAVTCTALTLPGPVRALWSDAEVRAPKYY